MVSIDFVLTRSRQDRISVPLGPLSVRPDLRCGTAPCLHGGPSDRTTPAALVLERLLVKDKHAPQTAATGWFFCRWFHTQIFAIVTQPEANVHRKQKKTWSIRRVLGATLGRPESGNVPDALRPQIRLCQLKHPVDTLQRSRAIGFLVFDAALNVYGLIDVCFNQA